MKTVNLSTIAARSTFVALVLAAGASMQARAQDIDPEAMQILRRMTDYMKDLQRFSVDTDNMTDVVFDSGQKIQYDLSANVLIQRPNKLRAERKGDVESQVIVYDGKALTIYNPAQNYYAVADAPDNLDDTLNFARDALDIVPPVGDLVYQNAFELLTRKLRSAAVVGKSMVAGVKCTHLAFQGPVVDWQIWIADGGQPLPRKYLIVTRDDPAQPQYMVLMSNWNVAPKVSPASFTLTPAQGAKKTEFLRMDTAKP